MPLYFTRDADKLGRMLVVALLIHSVAQRWDVLEAAYSDAGSLPAARWREQLNVVPWLHRVVCAHGWSGALGCLSARQSERRDARRGIRPRTAPRRCSRGSRSSPAGPCGGT